MKPHKIYSDNIDGKALAQFFDAMKQDYVVQGALMPDAHAGYALPIGAVVATKGVILPSWVGYDIGCGMCAAPTTFKREDIEANKKPIFDAIYERVPVGFKHNDSRSDVLFFYDGAVSDFVKKEIEGKDAPDKQIGTLGSGNHFIEIGYDETDTVWVIVHSGSRNVGHKIATHYMKLASKSDKAKEGHYALAVDSPEGQGYIADLTFALQFALDNRLVIMQRVERAIRSVLEAGNPYLISGMIGFDDMINRNHNHAEYRRIGHEVGEPQSVWIHRKGATHAEEGMMGVIPGNMRDGSFIVRGKGNPDSLFSSSHGAGRVLARKEASMTLDMDAFAATMTEHGIQARVERATLDEAPMAYKDIFKVMAEQSDLVEVIHHIKPIINIKG